MKYRPLLHLATVIALGLCGCGGQTIHQKTLISSELPLSQTLQSALDEAREKATVLGASASVCVDPLGSAPFEMIIANNWSSAGYVDLAPKPQPWTTTLPHLIYATSADLARWIRSLRAWIRAYEHIQLTSTCSQRVFAQITKDPIFFRIGSIGFAEQ